MRRVIARHAVILAGLFGVLVGGAGFVPDAVSTSEDAGIPTGLSFGISLVLAGLGSLVLWRRASPALPLTLLLAAAAALTGYHLRFIVGASATRSCGCLSLVGSPTHAQMLMICSGLMILCATSLHLWTPRGGRGRRPSSWPYLAIACAVVGLIVGLSFHAGEHAQRASGGVSGERGSSRDDPSLLGVGARAETNKQRAPEGEGQPVVSPEDGPWTVFVQIDAPLTAMAGVLGRVHALDHVSEAIVETEDFIVRERCEVRITGPPGKPAVARPATVMLDVPGCVSQSAPVTWQDSRGGCHFEISGVAHFHGKAVDGAGRAVPRLRLGLTTSGDGRELHGVLNRARGVALSDFRIATATTNEDGTFVVHGWGAFPATIEVLDPGWYPLDWTGGARSWRVTSTRRPSREAYPAGEPATLVVGRSLIAKLRVRVLDGAEHTIDCIEDAFGVDVRPISRVSPAASGGPLPFGAPVSEPTTVGKGSYLIATWLAIDGSVDPSTLPPVRVRAVAPGLEVVETDVAWRYADDRRPAPELTLKSTERLGGAKLNLRGAPEGFAGANPVVTYRSQGRDPLGPMRVVGRVDHNATLHIPSHLPPGPCVLTCRLWEGELEILVRSGHVASGTVQCRELCAIRVEVLDAETSAPLSRYGLGARDARARVRPFRPRDRTENWQSGGARVATVTAGSRRTSWLLWPNPAIRIYIGAAGYTPTSQVVEPKLGAVTDVQFRLHR